MRKAIIIMLALVVASSILPVSYACYTGWWGHWRPHRPITHCTLQCDVAFTHVHAYDNEGFLPEPKDVAQITASITDSGKKIVTTVTNAYPGYEGNVVFTVKNTGRCPIKITNITIDNDNPDELEISITEQRLKWGVLKPDGTRCGLLVYGITQQAAQNATYTFTIEIDAVQYIRCSPP